MRSKVVDFFNAISSANFDIIAITESWLKNDISDSEIFPHNYVVFRKDRITEGSKVSRGGGVVLAFKDTLSTTNLDLSIFNEMLPMIDIVGAKLQGTNFVKLYVLLIYLPPSTSFDDFSLFFELLSSLKILGDDKVLILGDFNTPSFNTSIPDRFGNIITVSYTSPSPRD
mgnify:FL=1